LKEINLYRDLKVSQMPAVYLHGVPGEVDSVTHNYVDTFVL